jgi:inward rectifier potassium channel
MASVKKYNPNLKTNPDTGFGTNVRDYGGRFINKDGSFNLRREGIALLNKLSIYQRMLSLPLWKFVAIIVLFYFFINILFSIAFLIIGTGQLQGIMAKTSWNKFKEVFYFSIQTFTTVGYGRINPVGDGANVVAAIEALTGFLSFGITTGLIYGRFAKPKSYLAFSDLALIGPYRDITGLMFRFVSYKDHHILTNVEIKVNLALQVEENGKHVFKFYDLPLERSKVDSLSMNWTVVHPINEDSPLHGYAYDDLKAGDAELYILVTGFDDAYSSRVLKRTSYTYEEIKMNAKFAPMYRESEDGKSTILEMHKLNEIVVFG